MTCLFSLDTGDSGKKKSTTLLTGVKSKTFWIKGIDYLYASKLVSQYTAEEFRSWFFQISLKKYAFFYEKEERAKEGAITCPYPFWRQSSYH